VKLPREPRREHAPDPLLRALARYVEALDRRYPEGPAHVHDRPLDARANMRTVASRDRREPAA
jgi:hypothetical protein